MEVLEYQPADDQGVRLYAAVKAGEELRMKESYRKGLAIHPDPESCVGGRKAAGEALTGAHAGRVSSCEINSLQGADAVMRSGRPHGRAATAASRPPDPAQSETLCMRGNSSRGNREIPRVPAVRCVAGGSAGKAMSRKPGMHAGGKSDGRVVPEKRAEQGRERPSPAEVRGGKAVDQGEHDADGRAPDTEPGGACRSDSATCARGGTSGSKLHGSPPCCTT